MININKVKLFILLCFLASNIFASNLIDQKKLLELTQEANDDDQVMSPNGRWLAYVKTSNFIVPSDCFYSASKGEHGEEIWIVDLKKMKKRLLVANHFTCGDVTEVILHPEHLEFSPDSKTLYFQTSAWVVSGAIHAVNVDGKNLRFVTDGNEYSVVRAGPYKGNLIVNQHRYHFGKEVGSYDWDWLYTPKGKLIKLYQKQN